MAIGTGAAIALAISAGATAGGSIAAARMQTNAAKEAAQTGAASADRSAELQAQGAREQLDYLKQKDKDTAAQFERTQRANYQQYVAKETRMNDIRAQLGMTVHPILPYEDVFGADPTAAAAGAVPGAPTTPPTGAQKLLSTALASDPRASAGAPATPPSRVSSLYLQPTASQPLVVPNTIGRFMPQ